MTGIRVRSAAALAGLTLIGVSTPALAAPDDYRFEPTTPILERGVGVTVAVEMRDRRTGRLVPGAEIRNPRVDRSPDGVAANFPAFVVPGLDYGRYQFRTDLPVAGQWALSWEARVFGEPAPIPGRVVLRVVDPAR